MLASSQSSSCSTDRSSSAISLIPDIGDSDATVALYRQNEVEVEASQGEWQCASPARFARFMLIAVLRAVEPLYQSGTIGSIPDDPLLVIFSFYVEESYKLYDPVVFGSIKELEAWRLLVHVCRRWRNLVFSSPRHLNLRLVCTGRKRVRDKLGLWPTLPIVIDGVELNRYNKLPEQHVDRIVAALEHRDRVCQISFTSIPLILIPTFIEMMEESFPSLTHLYLNFNSEAESPMLHSDSFLGGSAPHLRSLNLSGIPFPSLPTLLSTSKDLIELHLWRVPTSGYISPVAMATCLSSLTRLESLKLGLSPQSSHSSNHLPPSLTRIDLPTLTYFAFFGTNAHMEDLVAWINAPLLQDIVISFYLDPPFNISQLNQFIGRVENFKILHRAVVDIEDPARFPQFSLFEDPVDGATLKLLVPCSLSEYQLLSLVALSSSPSSPLRPSYFERLDIPNGFKPLEYRNDMEAVRWPELLQPFTSTKNLYLGNRNAPYIARVLQGLAVEGTVEVLPALQHIFLQDCQQFEELSESIGTFIAARQLFGRPVAIHRWEGFQKHDSQEEDD